MAQPDSHDWSDALTRLDLMIRQGEVSSAARELKTRLRDRTRFPLPRPLLSSVSALCRRTGEAESAIRILGPVTRPSVPRGRRGRQQIEATPAEKTEYGAALIQIGALFEGTEILTAVNPATAPQALLHLAFACFSQWDYQRALPFLKAYLQCPTLSDYQRLVGEVNQVAAWVALDQVDLALARVQPLKERTKKLGHRLLHGNLTMLLAEILIEQQQWKRAETVLQKALSSVDQNQGIDALLIRKWREVARLRQHPESLQGLRQVRAEARRFRHWETVRDCDFHLARASASPTLFRHLYWGTPHSAYRARIRAATNAEVFDQSPQYTWNPEKPGTSRTATTQLIDLSTGSPEKCLSGVRLKEGQVPQRLLQLLCSDFYRPQRLAAIHAELFPGRHYHPLHSPDIVHQAIRRLRSHFTAHSLPFVIEESHRSYRLRSPQGWGILLPPKISEDSSNPLTPEQSRKLRERLQLIAINRNAPSSEFTRKQVETVLGISSRSANLFLLQAEKTGHVAKYPRGRSSTYALIEPKAGSRNEISVSFRNPKQYQESHHEKCSAQ